MRLDCCLSAFIASALLCFSCSTISAQHLDVHQCKAHLIGKVSLSKASLDRKRILKEPIGFVDDDCSYWRVPPGTHTDGASIPRLAQFVFGGPWEEDYLPAAIIHDWYCDRRTQSWQGVHRMFFHAMLANGVNRHKAQLMYAAVYFKGPRWTDQAILNNNLLNTAVLPGVAEFDKRVTEAGEHVHTKNDFELFPPEEQELAKIVASEDLTTDQIDSLAEQARTWYPRTAEAEHWLRNKMDEFLKERAAAQPK